MEKKELQFNSNMFIDSKSVKDINNRISKEEIKMLKEMKIKFPSSITRGFSGYSNYLIKDPIFSADKKGINNFIEELINNLEDSKIYSLLFMIHNNEDNKCYMILPKSILVSNETSVSVLTRVLIDYLIEIESKYHIFSSHTLIVQGRI